MDKNEFSFFVFGYLIPTIERMFYKGVCELDHYSYADPDSLEAWAFEDWTCTSDKNKSNGKSFKYWVNAYDSDPCCPMTVCTTYK